MPTKKEDLPVEKVVEEVKKLEKKSPSKKKVVEVVEVKVLKRIEQKEVAKVTIEEGKVQVVDINGVGYTLSPQEYADKLKFD